MTDTSKTLNEQIEALETKADQLEEKARETGRLPEATDEEEGVGRVTGLVP